MREQGAEFLQKSWPNLKNGVRSVRRRDVENLPLLGQGAGDRCNQENCRRLPRTISADLSAGEANEGKSEYDNNIATTDPTRYETPGFMNPLPRSDFKGLNAEDAAFWLSESKFQKQAHWLRHSFVVRWLGRPEGLQEAVDEGMATCGPASFAAITGWALTAALVYFPHIPDRPWTNRTQMERALFEAGFDCDRKHADWPTAGLCLIQFTGPWTERGFEQAALKFTHWVAVLGEYVFDVNWNGWLPRNNWEEVVLHELLACKSAASGWRVLASYELPVEPSWYRQLPPSLLLD